MYISSDRQQRYFPAIGRCRNHGGLSGMSIQAVVSGCVVLWEKYVSFRFLSASYFTPSVFIFYACGMSNLRKVHMPLFYRSSILIVLAMLAVLVGGLWFCDLRANPKQGNLSLGRFVFFVLCLTSICSLSAVCFWCRFRYYLPIHRLLKEIRQLRNGTRSEPIRVQKCHQVAPLIREYNRLFHALQNTREELACARHRVEQKIHDHTNQLQCNIRQLEKQADTDPLSGLTNRNRFQERLEEMFEDAKLHSSDLACLIFDIDHFKTVNDQLGHTVGDHIIAFVGQLLRASIRSGDLAARYGGDEFVLLLPGCGEQQAWAIAERIRLLFSRESSHLISKGTDVKLVSGEDPGAEPSNGSCYLSIGIATIWKNSPCSAGHLIELADQALYQVKQNGRNAVAACSC